VKIRLAGIQCYNNPRRNTGAIRNTIGFIVVNRCPRFVPSFSDCGIWGHVGC